MDPGWESSLTIVTGVILWRELQRPSLGLLCRLGDAFAILPMGSDGAIGVPGR